MLTITNNAADELKLNLTNPDNQGLLIRFAVDTSGEHWQYLMGFDERKPNDIHLKDNGVEYIVAYEMKDLLDGTTLDYDEIDKETGYGFIFLNPNDPNFIPPTE
jgi:Fe-S cluster assembly iron-binding protein IscA